MKQTKQILTIGLFFLVSIYGFGQIDLENEIISSLIQQEFKQMPNDTIFNHKGKIKRIRTYKEPEINLIIETGFNLSDSKVSAYVICSQARLVYTDSTMYSELIENNKKSINIDSLKDFKYPVTYLTKNQIKQVFDKGGWENYHSIYGFKPLIQLSRPSLNTEKTFAYMYYSITTDQLGGAGFYVVLEKVNNTWIVKESKLAWIS